MNSEAHEKALEANRIRIDQETVAFQRRIRSRGIIRSCLECSYWSEVTRIEQLENGESLLKGVSYKCSLYNTLPPPYIIVDGCKDHDFIPF